MISYYLSNQYQIVDNILNPLRKDQLAGPAVGRTGRQRAVGLRNFFLWDPSAKRCPTRTSPRRRQAPRSPETTFENVPGPRRCQREKCCRCSQGDALYATKRPGNNSAGARQPRHRAYKGCFKCPWTAIRAAWPGIEHELARRVEAAHGLEPPR